MRILITHELFPPNVAGGGEKLIFKIAKALVEKGHSVKVLTSGDSKIKEYDGIKTVRVPINRYSMNLTAFLIAYHTRDVDIIQTSSGNVCFPSWVAAKLMNKHNVFTIGGSDMFGLPFVERIKEDITCNVDAGYTPAQALKHWTGNAGKVLKWSGPKDPYPTYKLGTIAKDAYADILLWDGDPLKDIKLILDESKLHFIMKDGMVYKNTIVKGDHPYFRPAKTPNTRGKYPL